MRTIVLAMLVLAGIALVGTSPGTAAPANGALLGAAAAGPTGEPVHCRPYVHRHSWGWGTGCVRHVAPVGPVIVAPRRHYCVRRCGPYSCRTVCY
jgi:hypothetical protein